MTNLTVSELKEYLSKRCDLYYEDQINNSYSHSQILRILCGIDPGLDDLKKFLNDLETEKQDLQDAISLLVDKEIISGFGKGSDSEMLTAITDYFPNLSERQKYALIEALYPLSS